jgi:hypothetical protein
VKSSGGIAVTTLTQPTTLFTPEEYLAFFYPDVTAVCGELQFHDDRKEIILSMFWSRKIIRTSSNT